MSDNPTAPTIEIPGFLMLPAPELTAQEAFGNFEELARGTSNIAALDRLRLLQSLKVIGDLVGHLPAVTLDEAIDNFDALAEQHECNRALQMALLQSVKILKDLVNSEKARLVEEKKAEEDKPKD